MRAVVTGAAGFIGSTLTDTLLADGHDVVGIDCFTPYYEPERKRTNLDAALAHPHFELVNEDLRTADLAPMLTGSDVVFHQAGQPGVRLSWSDQFEEYSSNNVLATQRLLDAAHTVGIGRLVYASSSSVYGNAERYPTMESDLPRPQSPYGVTKLAGEHLCNLFAANWGLPTVALRYFTVYGPRQRPDMAFHRAVLASLSGEAFPLYGDGCQRRDFTFVDDAVDACMRAALADVEPGTVLNIAGGTTVELLSVLSIIEGLTGAPIALDRRDPAPGDVYETGGSIERARALLGWEPRVALDAGLAAQVEWHRNQLTNS
jgi:nucleoside-diphosphate-sugar epimerase